MVQRFSADQQVLSFSQGSRNELLRYYPSGIGSSLCCTPSTPQCQTAAGDISLTHIWWGCPQIQIFWSKVTDLIKLITGIELENDPASLLFMIPIPTYTPGYFPPDCGKDYPPQTLEVLFNPFIVRLV